MPSLGGAVGVWIQAHCAIPDGARQGEPFLLTGDMWDFLLNFYALDARGRFLHPRGGLLVRPAKFGKGPFSAAIVAAEAAGPTRFAGWNPTSGEPQGRPHPSPWIQIAAVSESQTANVWRALGPMLELGDVAHAVEDVGLTRITLPSGGRIEYVTAAHRSRVGARTTFDVWDELGFWLPQNHGPELADALARNLAGMQGRFLGTTNAWALSEESVAERLADEQGVYVDDVEPGRYSIRNKAERRRALARVYGDSARGCEAQANGAGRIEPWIDLDTIEAAVESLIDRDEPQARRFYLNEKLAARSAAFDFQRFRELANPTYRPAAGAAVVLTVDGALNRDACAVMATEIETGFQWPVAIETRPDTAADDYRHDLEAIDAAVVDAWDTYTVRHMRIDPQYLEPLVARWHARWGDRKVVPFYTNTQTGKLAHAVRRYSEAIASGELSHDGDETFAAHVRAAVRRPTHVRDDDGRPLHLIQKDHPNSPRKIDAAMAAVMGWEARFEALGEHVEPTPSSLLEETPQRDEASEYVARHGDLILTGDHHRDQEPGDLVGPRRGR